jgi:hypothetical protein
MELPSLNVIPIRVFSISLYLPGFCGLRSLCWRLWGPHLWFYAAGNTTSPTPQWYPSRKISVSGTTSFLLSPFASCRTSTLREQSTKSKRMTVCHVVSSNKEKIDHAVSRRLPTAAARVQTRVWSCRIL